MGLVDDLNRLSDMHAAGQLTDEEFDEAKTRMIRESTGTATPAGDTAGGMSTSPLYDPTLTPPSEAFDVEPSALPPSASYAPPVPSAPPPPGFTSTTVHGARPAAPTGTTVITSGLGTGSVSLGALPPQTRLRTRAVGLTAPGSVEPKRTAKKTFLVSLGCLTIPILFVALMIATAGVAMFPGLARLTAPILCEAPFDHSYVEITKSNPRPGETTWNWELQCYNDRGAIEPQNSFTVMGLLFAGFAAAMFALVLLLSLIGAVRGRSKRRRQGDPIQPVPPSGSLGDLSNSGGPIVNPPS